MNLEEILKMWEKDSAIDEMNLDDATRDSAKMHAKYLELHSITKLQLKRLEAQFQQLLRDKYLWFNGKMSKDQIEQKGWAYDPFDGCSKPMKGEMSYFYDSDDDIQTAKAKIDYNKVMLETLDEIINTLRWRHQQISNMIKWRQFTSGV